MQKLPAPSDAATRAGRDFLKKAGYSEGAAYRFLATGKGVMDAEIAIGFRERGHGSLVTSFVHRFARLDASFARALLKDAGPEALMPNLSRFSGLDAALGRKLVTERDNLMLGPYAFAFVPEAQEAVLIGWLKRHRDEADLVNPHLKLFSGLTDKAAAALLAAVPKGDAKEQAAYFKKFPDANTPAALLRHLASFPLVHGDALATSLRKHGFGDLADKHARRLEAHG